MKDCFNKFLIIFSFGLLISFCLVIFVYTDAQAAPAAPIELTLTQPDGVEFQAVPWGDEWLNGMETSDGYSIILSEETNYWVYAELSTDQKLSPTMIRGSELVVGKDDPNGLAKHIRPEEPIIDRSEAFSNAASFQKSNIDTHKVLVLLVEFLDTKAKTTPEHWHNLIFGQTNSVNHFYSEASFGQMGLSPASESFDISDDGVIGWLTLPYNHPNSGGNISASSQNIALDALQLVDTYVNFSTFDKNWDGMISYDELHIMIIVAGYETAYGGSSGSCTPNIWGHAWSFVWDAPIFDGVRVASSIGDGGYSQVGERHCEISDPPGQPATIGILAHEFGHELGWPDLYDISGQSTGLGYWDVMSNGLWNNSGPNTPDGSSPALPNPWSRWHQGWLEPEKITTSHLNIIIPAIQESSMVYQLLDNPNGVDWEFNWRSGMGEFYLVENRQPTGYDVGLPGSGLLIWHINENRPYDNYANADPNRRLVDLVQADGLRQLNLGNDDRGDPGDPYPGSTQNRTFNSSSIPSSNLNGFPTGVSITTISDSGPVMTAYLFVPSFNDILVTDWFWGAIEALAASEITTGCGEGNYCPEQPTTRAQIAVLLMRAEKGPTYIPPSGSGIFSDVSSSYWAADWIEALYAEGITVGCGEDPLRYCPEETVTRAEMAVFLMRSKYGSLYSPPRAQGIFADFEINYWAADWIEQLYQEGITTGCAFDPLQYCPEEIVTRAEIAVFLMRLYNLPNP